MGINTIHDYADDYMVSENLTNGTKIRGNVLSNVNFNRFEAVTGIPRNKVSMVIRANGWCQVSVGDKVRVPVDGKIYKVMQILNNYDNPLEFKRRKDSENFTGASDIYLE